MFGLAGYELLFCGGITVMAAAGIVFAVQAVYYIIKRADIRRKLDEEYGQPQRYNRKDEG